MSHSSIQNAPRGSAFDTSEAFVPRHIGPGEQDQQMMLNAVGASSLDMLMQEVVPANIRMSKPLDLPGPRDEADVLNEMREMAAQNKVYRNYIGQGYYGTHTPNVILRNILENPAWYTAYTPYQPEISQGRLEAILNYQTMVADLTGLDIANASLLDEATAAAEAMTLSRRASQSKSNVFFVSAHCHPQTIEVIRTRADGLDIEVVVGDESQGVPDCFGLLVQYPHSLGRVVDYRALTEQVHAQGGVVACATDLLALALLEPPGHWGADIAIGSAQRFGVPFGFGGPHAGFMSCQDSFKRNMPGRLVGVSKDAQGNPALRLALQTREQHIRREKATSNICTAQVLLAVMASMYALWHGPKGLVAIARRVHLSAAALRKALLAAGVNVLNDTFFDTLLLETGVRTTQVLQAARQAQINLRLVNANQVALSLDETVTVHDLTALVSLFANVMGKPAPVIDLTADAHSALLGVPASVVRQKPILSHPVFSSIQSETDMLRYLRKLSDKDLALDRTMIPLGSCTMKLNATVEMIPVTWPEFALIHPFAPAEQTRGYATMIERLSKALCEITGYDAISLQPNSGAQGEYAGLLAIRAYHRANGQSQRDVCLIPASAHGTNPASANMVGMEVVVVASDAKGNVDMADLQSKIDQVGDRLAALMITYPSTHGVFEETITQICDMIHAAGGQVYMDGANMNAMVGVAQPGKFGSDVSHLNLHKTFCIPHGGGGPGVGPVAVRSHLAPYLPGVVTEQGCLSEDVPVGPVSAAPFGSASILPIPMVYIALMGAEGLRRATEIAILSANYVARRLEAHYPVLYTGRHGRVAHECILDMHDIKERSGISAEDIAKRLMDYGFHAPTMSFPVAGTLMVEPTESESLAELDRFIDAMIAIRHEIAQIESGERDKTDNVLKNAPHTAQMLLAQEWHHDYPRQQAAYPVASLRDNKYWPPVGRVDNAWGDRNLVCACLPIEAYA
jgi:glycine dehydrogenase